MNARDRPCSKRFYAIEWNDNDTVNVYLIPFGTAYDTDIGIKEHDIDVRVVRGVTPWPELEDDIRQRYESWCEAATRLDI